MQLVSVTNDRDISPSVSWCTKNLIDRDWQIILNWPSPGIKFQFNKEEDAVWFSLNCIK